MSTILEILGKLWKSVETVITKQLADDIIEGEKLKKEVEEDLKEIEKE